jgi:chromosome segregation protein
VRPEGGVAALAERLLAGVWVVDSLEALPESFSGIAVTRAGRLFDARSGELAQAPAGGAERLLEELGRRDELVAASEGAATDEFQARAALERHGRRGGFCARDRRERAAYRAAGGGRRRGDR